MPKLGLFTILAIIAVIFAASETTVLACSCSRRPTLPDEVEQSNIIAVMKVASLEMGTAEMGPRFMDGYPIAAKMIVEKVFKGDVKVGEEVLFRQGTGADCVWHFEEKSVGTRYLFYLTSPTVARPYSTSPDKDIRSMYNGSTCGRSGPVGLTGRDVAVLKDLKKLSGRSRVSGTFRASFNAGNPNLADIKIRFTGAAGAFETKTDKSGYYEIYDLPAGDYSMEFTPPAGWKASEDFLRYMRDWIEPATADRLGVLHQVQIRVNKGGHVDLDLAVERVGSISGRVISPNGAPVKNIGIRAVAFNIVKEWEKAWHIRTNEEGEFSFKGLTPGEYVLVVSNDGRMSSRHPFGTIFYPGTTDIQNAARIRVVGPVENVVLQIPSFIKLVGTNVRFIFSDGTPVRGQNVFFAPDAPEKFELEDSITDDKGNYRFNIPLDASGKFFGKTYISVQGAANCPKQKALIEAAGGVGIQLKSNEVNIPSGGAETSIDLTLAFPSCEKPK